MRALTTCLPLSCAALLAIAGCSNTVTEYTLDSDRRVTHVERLTRDANWKHGEDDHIAAELAGRKPDAGKKTWREYWRWRYENIRLNPGPPPWKPTEFKNAEDMIAYIERHRKERGLPPYDKT